MFERIMGIITFKAPTYRAIAVDKTAINQAAIIVMVVALIQGICSDLITTVASGINPSLMQVIISAVLNVILGLIVWVMIAWLLTVIARAFGGQTGTGEMRRVAGFVQIFGLVTVFSLLALKTPANSFTDFLIALAILVLSLVGYFIGVREAAGLAAGKAMITAVLASAASFVVIIVLDNVSIAVFSYILRFAG